MSTTTLVPEAAWAAARQLYVTDPDMEVDEFEALLDTPDDPRLRRDSVVIPSPQPKRAPNAAAGRNLASDVTATLLMLAIAAAGFSALIFAMVR